jgi:hypothetical protein
MLAGIELSALSGYDCVEVLKAQSRQVNHEQARLMATMVEVGLCGLGHAGESPRMAMPDESATPAWTTRLSSSTFATPMRVRTCLPATRPAIAKPTSRSVLRSALAWSCGCGAVHIAGARRVSSRAGRLGAGARRAGPGTRHDAGRRAVALRDHDEHGQLSHCGITTARLSGAPSGKPAAGRSWSSKSPPALWRHSPSSPTGLAPGRSSGPLARRWETCGVPEERFAADIQQPPQGRALRRYLQARDRSCIMIQHEGGWQIRQDRLGYFCWTTRLGHSYLRQPLPIMKPLPERRAHPPGR